MEDHAIVVGINEYPGISNLKGAVRDAKNFYRWLRKHGGLKRSNITMILSPHPQAPVFIDATPTFSDINKAFLKLIHKASNTPGLKLGRRLYIYFSGHGFCLDRSEDTALITANSNPQTSLENFPGKSAADYFKRAAMFDEIVLLMDCCRENLPNYALQTLSWSNYINGPASSNVKLFYAFATKWSLKAREYPLTNDKYEGVFTRAVLNGLTNGISNSNQQVTGTTLKDFIYNYLSAKSQELGIIQEPDIYANSQADIIFVEHKDPDTSFLDITVENQGIESIMIKNMVNGVEQIVQSIKVNSSEKKYSVSIVPGIYELSFMPDSIPSQFKKVIGGHINVTV